VTTTDGAALQHHEEQAVVVVITFLPWSWRTETLLIDGALNLHSDISNQHHQ
jgi:hypothetical protein